MVPRAFGLADQVSIGGGLLGAPVSKTTQVCFPQRIVAGAWNHAQAPGWSWGAGAEMTFARFDHSTLFLPTARPDGTRRRYELEWWH